MDQTCSSGSITDGAPKYVWQRPVQVDLDSTFAQANQGLYNYMQGPSESTIVWDAPDETNRVVRAFLQSVDSTRSKP